MGQPEVLAYINKQKRAVDVIELIKHFKTTQSSMSRIVRQLERYKMIRVTIVRQKKLITKRDER